MTRKYYDTFGEIYEELQESDRDRGRLSAVLKKIVGNIENKKVFDAGCGYGKDSKWLAEKGAKVVAMDASPRMIKLVKRNCGSNVKAIVGDFEKTNFENNEFDVVISVNSVTYKRNLDNVLREFRRILKKNGNLYLVVPHPIRKMIVYSKFNYFRTGRHTETYRGKVKRFGYYRTIGDYLKFIKNAKFTVDNFIEPKTIRRKIDKKMSSGVALPKTTWYPHHIIFILRK